MTSPIRTCPVCLCSSDEVMIFVVSNKKPGADFRGGCCCDACGSSWEEEGLADGDRIISSVWEGDDSDFNTLKARYPE